MISFDNYFNENKTNYNWKWPYIPDHPYRMLVIEGLRSGKTNALLNLINNQPDIDKIYLYAKDPYDAKYQFLINKRESTGINTLPILKLSSSIQMICTTFTKILMNTIQIKNVKH